MFEPMIPVAPVRKTVVNGGPFSLSHSDAVAVVTNVRVGTAGGEPSFCRVGPRDVGWPGLGAASESYVVPARDVVDCWGASPPPAGVPAGSGVAEGA